MLRLVVKNEAVAKFLYRLPHADIIVRADLRHIGRWQDDRTIDRAYSDVPTTNGTSKQTQRGRFQDLEPIVLELLSATRTPRIHDVGVSSGITSVDLYEALLKKDFAAALVVSDQYAVYYWIEHNGGVAFYDADGILRYAYKRGVVGSAEDSSWFPISRAVFKQFESPLPCGVEPHSIELYHPALLRLVRAGKVKTCTYDVFTTKSPPEYDFVRCMNLLNPKYFNQSDLLRALHNIGTSVRDGGVFQLGRTMPDGLNHVSFFVRVGTRFERAREVRDGSEIKSLLRNVVLA
jgi:hypothetical protein